MFYIDVSVYTVYKLRIILRTFFLSFSSFPLWNFYLYLSVSQHTYTHTKTQFVVSFQRQRNDTNTYGIYECICICASIQFICSHSAQCLMLIIVSPRFFLLLFHYILFAYTSVMRMYCSLINDQELGFFLHYLMFTLDSPQ